MSLKEGRLSKLVASPSVRLGSPKQPGIPAPALSLHSPNKTMPPPLENKGDTHEDQPEHSSSAIDLDLPNTSYNNISSPNTIGPTKARPTWKPGGDYLAGLRALPEVRPMPVKEGKGLPPAKSTESIRPSTKGAYLLATRGIVRNPPCNHCATGAGRFSLCVSLDNWFHGACATCQMATRGHLCSLRIELDGMALFSGRGLCSAD
jgi:hypothetical protein